MGSLVGQTGIRIQASLIEINLKVGGLAMAYKKLPLASFPFAGKIGCSFIFVALMPFIQCCQVYKPRIHPVSHFSFETIAALNSLHYSLAKTMRDNSLNISYRGVLSRDGINLGFGWRDRENHPFEWQIYNIQEVVLDDGKIVDLEKPRELIGKILIVMKGQYVFREEEVDVQFDVIFEPGMQEIFGQTVLSSIRSALGRLKTGPKSEPL